MELNNIPNMTHEEIGEALSFVGENISKSRQDLPEWFNSTMKWLSENRKDVYKYLTARSELFATQAVLTPDSVLIASSIMVEYIFLLAIISKGISGTTDEKIKDMLKGVNLDGLDDI